MLDIDAAIVEAARLASGVAGLFLRQVPQRPYNSGSTTASGPYAEDLGLH
jgi:hypothetical protein